MAANPLPRLHELTIGQHGCVATWQASTVGVSANDLHRLRVRGLVTRVHPRVYRLAGLAESREATAMAAVLAAGPGAVLSRSWAAWLHDVDRVPLTPSPQVTRPGRIASTIAEVTVHLTRELESCDRTTVRDIPVTTGARTALDLADGVLDEADIMAVVDDLICRRATTRSFLYRRARHLANGRAGAPVIIRITGPGAEGEFWSWLERRFDASVVRSFGLPQPAYNVTLRDRQGRIGIADAVWAGEREVVVEVDGLRFHHLSSARRRDSRKSNRYALSGRIPLRFTYEDVVGHPERVAAQVREALESAGVAMVSGPRPAGEQSG